MSDSVLLAIATGVIGLLTLYVNKRHDSKSQALTLKCDEQDRRLDDCFEDHKECKEEAVKMKEELGVARKEVAERNAAENKSLQDQINRQSKEIEGLKKNC